MLSKDSAEFLLGVLNNQTVAVGNPDFRKIAEITATAKEELEAIVKSSPNGTVAKDSELLPSAN